MLHILPLLPVLGSELVSRRLAEMAWIQIRPGKTKHALSVIGKLFISKFESLPNFFVDGQLLAVD